MRERIIKKFFKLQLKHYYSMKVAIKVLFLALLFTNIYAVNAMSSISSISIEVFPKSGDITTNIAIQVRGEPYTRQYITTQRDYPVLNIYFDDLLIENKIVPLSMHIPGIIRPMKQVGITRLRYQMNILTQS